MFRSLRRRVLTPDISETKLATRGFHVKDDASRELLETIGETFLTGYAFAAETRSAAEAEERLEEIPRRFRGFAYEGAGMAFAILDRLTPGGGHRTADSLAGRGDAHNYMIYVGIGWAMARLPRFLWPDSRGLDPLLLWLVHDGYGFHQAYFHTQRYVHEQYRETRFPWPAGGPESYAARAIDQGIGRALWFVGGTDVEQVVSLVERFPRSRRADLYAGVGLAATYAGGAPEDELLELRERAGTYRPQLAQGSSFAAEARVRAGLLVPHNEVATRVLCGTTPEDAALTSRRTRPDGPVTGDLPAYEVWRRRIANEFAFAGGVTP
ncbi:DUF1702 family protein [Streptosporangium sandarakinum]|uniref:DUF1702 family protein n=1 Tax=Streptosporangium sandarakinum TaxID=1260955 RepID=UPI00341DAB60